MTTTASALRGYNLLVEIQSGPRDGREWRFALAHRTHSVVGAPDAAHDGVWPGIASVRGLRHELGTGGVVVSPAVRIELARGTDALTASDIAAIRAAEYFVGRRVRMYLVESARGVPSADSLVHVGMIERGDVEIGPYAVAISARDRIERDDRRIPALAYGDDAKIDPRWSGRAVPVLFGDFGAEQSDYWIEVACVDTQPFATDRPLRARLCRPGTHGIASFGARATWTDSSGRPRRDETGYRDFEIHVVDAAAGTFDLVGSEFDRMEVRFESGDEIRVARPRCERDTDGRLIESPVEVIRHLLTDPINGLGLGADEIDTASFASARAWADAWGYRCRALIDGETTVMDVIGRIGADFGLCLFVRSGLYTLVPAGGVDGAPTTTVDDARLLDAREWNDPQRLGGEELALRYRRRPDDGQFTRRVASGATAPVTHESDWIFDDESARAWLYDREARFASLRTVRARCDFALLGARLGDAVRVSGSLGEGDFQIASIGIDFDPPVSVELELVAHGEAPDAGVWSADTGESVPAAYGGGVMPADFAGASADQRAALSFWADAGDANPDGEPLKVWGR
ncbi:MAG: hypothetical protein KJ042_06110 [Deltaproteobacteria bacterium]|nr:hypothetical protein [Deltaproteobacteria bacterium]